MTSTHGVFAFSLLSLAAACRGAPPAPTPAIPLPTPSPTEPAAARTPPHLDPSGERFATRQGTRILIDGGPSFVVPDAWVANDEPRRPTIFLHPKVLIGKEVGGEWDREAAEIADAVFDLRDLAFQGGEDGWGEQSAGYLDVTLRVYVIESPEAAIERRLDEQGARALCHVLAAARQGNRNAAGERVPPPAGPTPPPREPTASEIAEHRPTRVVDGPWRHSHWRYQLSFGDYGGEANLHVYLRGMGPRTYAFAFLCSGGDALQPAVDKILASVDWNG